MKLGFLYLVLVFSCFAGSRFSIKDAVEDVKKLEKTLKEEWAFYNYKVVDPEVQFERARNDIEKYSKYITRYNLKKILSKLLGNFHDPEAQILRWADQGNKKYLPFFVHESSKGFVAVNDEREFYLDGYPYVTKLDNIKIEEWVYHAQKFRGVGSPGFMRQHGTERVRYIDLIRNEMAVGDSPLITVEFMNLKGEKLTKNIKLVFENRPYFRWPYKDSQKIQIKNKSVGYLRVFGMEKSEEAIKEVHNLMSKFRETNGLIIDLRGLRGGHRHIAKELLPYFLDKKQSRVANVSVIRNPTEEKISLSEELFLLKINEYKNRFPMIFLKKEFEPSYKFEKKDFSEYRYFLIEGRNQKYFYPGKVIILQDRRSQGAADVFLSAAKYLPNVTLVGQTSGGADGMVTSTVLDKSEIRIFYSRILSFQSTGKMLSGVGVRPDIKINYNYDDFFGTKDSFIKKAIYLITK